MENNKLTGKQILIADDDYTCYRYIQAILEKSGACFHWVNNGLHAVEFIKLNPDIDLIFMDLLMPVMGGKEAIEQIKLLNNDIPIIIQSASVHETYTAVQLKNEFVYLEKPFKPKEVHHIINTIFEK